jgi:hypothetical protein
VLNMCEAFFFDCSLLGLCGQIFSRFARLWERGFLHGNLNAPSSQPIRSRDKLLNTLVSSCLFLTRTHIYTSLNVNYCLNYLFIRQQKAMYDSLFSLVPNPFFLPFVLHPLLMARVTLRAVRITYVPIFLSCTFTCFHTVFLEVWVGSGKSSTGALCPEVSHMSGELTNRCLRLPRKT